MQHVRRALAHDRQARRNPRPKARTQDATARLPVCAFKRREPITPMAAIGVLDELRFAEARLTLQKKLADLLRTVDQNAWRASEIEADDVSVLLGECRQEPKHIGSPKVVIELAQVLAFGAGWRSRHQPPTPADPSPAPSARASSKALAWLRSRVSKPSVNQP